MLQIRRKPGCGSTNGIGAESLRFFDSTSTEDPECEILGRPGSGSNNVDESKNIRTPGSGSKNVVRVKVIPKAERIVDMR